MEGEEVSSTDTILREIYYNPNNPGSFGGASKLWKAVITDGHTLNPKLMNNIIHNKQK